MLYNAKKAFVFPGQGAQYVGMAKDFLDSDQTILKTVETLKKRTGLNIYDVMLNGPEELLKETRITQPAILLHSISALMSFLKKTELKPDYVAGHSLGEFSALVANGCLSLEDALYIVHKRGEFMINANKGKPYAMAAIMGLDPEILNELCEEVSKDNLVVIANYNTPEQFVISGTEKGVEAVITKAKEKKAKRAIPLQVGGPFHSPLISDARQQLKEELEKISVNDSDIPVIANIDAKPYNTAAIIKDNLVKQVTSSVLWVDSIKFLVNSGVQYFFEFGPKKVVSGMIKKIDRNVKVFSIDNMNDVDLVLKELENEQV